MYSSDEKTSGLVQARVRAAGDWLEWAVQQGVLTVVLMGILLLGWGGEGRAAQILEPVLPEAGVVHIPDVGPALPMPRERGRNEPLDLGVSGRPVNKTASPAPAHPSGPVKKAAAGANSRAAGASAAGAGSSGGRAPGAAGAGGNTLSGNGCTQWPEWAEFRARFITPEGRVVDHGAGSVTTSEGQSYALMFALVARDGERFQKILEWTENNLAGGDLSARLPAWQWGKRPDGQWGVMDSNAASDADLWIAYALSEAARLWRVPRYGALGELLADRILREETVLVPGKGRLLLPGPQGFQPQEQVWRLNPSYVPVQLLDRMAQSFPHSEWVGMPAAAVQFLIHSAPHGFAPDWVLLDGTSGRYAADPDTHGVGSFNAIRVYLWAGMLEAKSPGRASLLKAFKPLAVEIEHSGVVPLELGAFDGKVQGAGPAGFSAAVLPFLSALEQGNSLHQQQLRVQALQPEATATPRYYDSVLELFGLGWAQGRFRFGPHGTLELHGTSCPSEPQLH